MKLQSVLAAALVAFVLCSNLHSQTLQLKSTKAIDDQTAQIGGDPVEIDLSEFFELEGVTGQIVELDYNLGVVNIEMLATAAPLTVANFLNYVDDGDYDNSMIHRSLTGFVLQGGGFRAGFPVVAIPADPPVVNEFNLSNLIGTLSMAKLGNDPDSATNQYFINLGDNSGNLDEQNGGFTVFARVIGSGMATVGVMEDVTVWSRSGLNEPGIDLLQNGSSFNDVPLLGTANDPIAAEFMIVLETARRVTAFPNSDGSPSMVSFAATSSAPEIADASFDGSILVLTPGGASLGSTTIVVTATDTNGNEVSDDFVVEVEPAAPFFMTQPMPRAVEVGRPVTLSAEVESALAATYQWNLDGSPITGATESTYIIASFSNSDAGEYTLSVTNSEGTSVSSPAMLIAIEASARLINISTRGIARSGESAMIVGYYLSGVSGEKEMIIRAIGPDLLNRGIEGAMLDPQIRLLSVGGSGVSLANDNWENGNDLEYLTELMPRSGATGLMDGSKDSVIVGSFPISGYTALIGPNVGEVDGIVLAEAFDADEDRLNSDVRLFNIATRAEVGVGDDVLIAGFWVVGGEKANLLVRAIGPGLAKDGVQNAISDIELRVVDGAGNTVGASDDWGDSLHRDTLVREMIGAGAIVPDEGSKDAATIVTLDPGGYSVVVSGVGGETGVGLVEVFEIR